MAIGLAFAPSSVTVAEAPPEPPFSPDDVAGLELWYKADTGVLDASDVPITVDGTAVKTWQDQSVSANHAVQATAGSRPLWKENLVNGKPVLRFDGTDDFFHQTVSADSSRTIFIVTRKVTAPVAASKSPMGFHANAEIFTHSGLHATHWLWFGDQALATVDLGGTATDFTILGLKITSGGSLTPYVNGTAGSAFDPRDEVTSSTTLGLGRADVGTNLGNYDIAEFIMYSSALVDADRDDVEDYLGTRYGITVA